MFFSFFLSRGGSVSRSIYKKFGTAVGRPTFESFDDEGGCGGNNRDSGLTVLDSELDSDPETLPLASGFCDIFTDLLG